MSLIQSLKDYYGGLEIKDLVWRAPSAAERRAIAAKDRRELKDTRRIDCPLPGHDPVPGDHHRWTYTPYLGTFCQDCHAVCAIYVYKEFKSCSGHREFYHGGPDDQDVRSYPPRCPPNERKQAVGP